MYSRIYTRYRKVLICNFSTIVIQSCIHILYLHTLGPSTTNRNNRLLSARDYHKWFRSCGSWNREYVESLNMKLVPRSLPSCQTKPRKRTYHTRQCHGTLREFATLMHSVMESQILSGNETSFSMVSTRTYLNVRSNLTQITFLRT